ncbi:type VII secretion system-associated protein [Nocardia sp. NPDC003345]
MGDPSPEAVRYGDWFVLVDPGWEPGSRSTPPPPEVIVGGWELGPDGTAGPFRPNPRYRPGDPAAPTDPLDALLRLVVTAGRIGGEVLDTMADTVVEIGCDSEDRPLLGRAPDGTPCVVVVTAESQKTHLDVDRWWPVHGRDLAGLVPPGADVLVNPAGAAPVRLRTEALYGRDPGGEHA